MTLIDKRIWDLKAVCVRARQEIDLIRGELIEKVIFDFALSFSISLFRVSQNCNFYVAFQFNSLDDNPHINKSAFRLGKLISSTIDWNNDEKMVINNLTHWRYRRHNADISLWQLLLSCNGSFIWHCFYGVQKIHKVMTQFRWARQRWNKSRKKSMGIYRLPANDAFHKMDVLSS